MGTIMEASKVKLLATGAVGFTLLILAEAEEADGSLLNPSFEALVLSSLATNSSNSTGVTGILGVVSKFNGKASFDEHVYDVIKQHGDFPVDKAINFMRDVSSYNDKTEEHLDTEAQAYDAIHSAAKKSS